MTTPYTENKTSDKLDAKPIPVAADVFPYGDSTDLDGTDFRGKFMTRDEVLTMIESFRKYDYSVGSTLNYTDLGGLINSSNQLFTVSAAKYVAGSLLLYYNGRLTVDYVETNVAIGTFTTGFTPSDAGPVLDTLMAVYYAL